MKVNTDGVLLAAWTNLEYIAEQKKQGRLLETLDIGTGTGVIALILAQRFSQTLSAQSKTKFKITGIDIDSLSIEDARYNFKSSLWKDCLKSETISLQEHLLKHKAKYSLIISNPPYFTNSSKAPSQRRSAARHNDTLPLQILIEATSLMLEDNGILSMILPVKEGMEIIKSARNHSLFLSRLCRVKTTPAKPEKRYMLEFKKGNNITPYVEELIIHNADSTYTEHYCNLISDYYYKDFRAGSESMPETI